MSWGIAWARFGGSCSLILTIKKMKPPDQEQPEEAKQGKQTGLSPKRRFGGRGLNPCRHVRCHRVGLTAGGAFDLFSFQVNGDPQSFSARTFHSDER